MDDLLHIGAGKSRVFINIATLNECVAKLKKVKSDSGQRVSVPHSP